ncbi:MAG: DDE-type integrase/transposase/recombinase [Candidatus Daviesbacteria bacterium]|nr:DDE-type integrase/transposase/recombinase [Candidatus Daviesbacteria bacterium]
MKVKDFNLSKDALKRLYWMDWYFSHRKNAEATCRHFNISKSVFYRWLPRFNKFNLSSLEFDTKLRKPHHLREMTTSREVVNLICSIRADDLEKSKYEIQAELKDLHGVIIGYNTIQKVINRNPKLLNTFHKKKFKAHRKLKIARLRAARELKEKDLGSLVQIDTKYLYILTSRFYLFVAIDCKSRFGFIRAYKTISSTSAADFLTKVIDYFPFKIEAINTDNGSEYLLNFHKLTQELNIPHYFSHPHTPKENSRAERLIQTIEYEFFNYQDDLLNDSLDEINRRCNIFNTKYNQKRYHHSLHYQTPSAYIKSYLEKRGQPFSI